MRLWVIHRNGVPVAVVHAPSRIDIMMRFRRAHELTIIPAGRSHVH